MKNLICLLTLFLLTNIGYASNITNTNSSPTISNKPQVSKTVGKPSLVKKHPYPKYFMRVPQITDFNNINNTVGNYFISVPKSFGDDPLKGLPQAQGAMLLRTASENLMFAVTVLDPADTISFKNTQPLPSYNNKKVMLSWTHGNNLFWQCQLSRHIDYQGDKLLLEAQTNHNNKVYQMLFVIPFVKYNVFLPQALYTLNSFREIS